MKISMKNFFAPDNEQRNFSSDFIKGQGAATFSFDFDRGKEIFHRKLEKKTASMLKVGGKFSFFRIKIRGIFH